MAVAYESVATAAWEGNQAGETLVINKPSGLAVGDVMILHLVETSDDGNIGSFQDPAGWTLLHSRTHQSAVATALRVQVYKKTADASDVAASNFTFTHNSNDGGWTSGAIYRFSDAAADAIQAAVADSSGATPSFANTVTPPVPNSMLLLLILATGNSGSGSGATYAVATDNPVWTERVDSYGDASVFFGAGDGDGLMLGATAPRSQITATGNSSAALTGITDYSIGVLLAIPPITNVSPAPAVISTAMNIQAPTVAAAAVVSPAVIGMAAAVQAPTVAIGSPSWVNRDKPSAASVVNDDKP